MLSLITFGAAAVVFVVVTILWTVKLTVGTSVSGLISANESVSGTDSLGVQANPTVPVAQPAALTVRTTNTTGTLTMTNAGHGIVTGQRFDLYWVGGSCYGAIAGTVAGTSVPIASVSGGSALPSAGTSVTVGISTLATFGMVGDNLAALVLSTGTEGYFVFNDGAADVYGVKLGAGRVHAWKSGDGYANPLAGATPTRVYMSHSSTTAAVTSMQAAAVSH